MLVPPLTQDLVYWSCPSQTTFQLKDFKMGDRFKVTPHGRLPHLPPQARARRSSSTLRPLGLQQRVLAHARQVSDDLLPDGRAHVKPAPTPHCARASTFRVPAAAAAGDLTLARYVLLLLLCTRLRQREMAVAGQGSSKRKKTTDRRGGRRSCGSANALS